MGQSPAADADASHYLEEELRAEIASDPRILTFLFNHVLDGTWYWDIENPEEEWMSEGFWRTLGYDPAERSHKAAEWQNLIHPDDLKVALANFERHCEDPSHPYDQIVRYKRSEGDAQEWTTVRCRGLAIRDADGKPIRLLGAHTDITELRSVGRELGRTSVLFERVLETANSAIMGIGASRRVLTANDAARHVLGRLSGALPAAWPDMIQFLNPEDLTPLEASDDPIERAIAGVDLSNETNVMTRGAGSMNRYVRISSSTVADPTSELRTVVVLDDITEQETTRQQAERSSRLDALGQLTGGIAHDFNNLLGTVLYAIELTESEPQSDRIKRILGAAKDSVSRGSQLTQRLLAFAKRQPAMAKSRLTIDTFTDLRALTDPTIEQTILVRTVLEDPTLWIFCDHTQLDTALLNLVLNSRDAILRSGVGDQITISARSVSEKDMDRSQLVEPSDTYIGQKRRDDHKRDLERGDARALRYVEVAVTDNGPGMTEEVKRRAIDPFFTTKGVNSGTGLGLSIVYGFVQQAGGELSIYSEEGEGTTIRLLLPRGTPEGMRESPMDREPIAVGEGETIMLVEDDRNLLMMMEDMLEHMGYHIVIARSGKEALKLADSGVAFDVLLTDIVMPEGVGGFELAKRLRERRPDLPILYMSGYTGYSEQEMGEVIAPMVAKPCTPAELAKAIKQVTNPSET